MKVIIVGGVAAGMSAAARLRRLDERAHIVVFEKDECVAFANCGLPYHIGGAIAHRRSLLVQTPRSLREQSNLDVRVLTEVTAIRPEAHAVAVRNVRTGATTVEIYDKLVLAPGARALRPPMPGIDHPAVCALRNIADMDRIVAAVRIGPRGGIAGDAAMRTSHPDILAAGDVVETTELAYAPPYGSAKDPVNMAGFVAMNLVRGDVAFWYAEDFQERGADALQAVRPDLAPRTGDGRTTQYRKTPAKPDRLVRGRWPSRRQAPAVRTPRYRPADASPPAVAR